MRQDLIQASFSGGEINPEVFGRLDLDLYFKSAARIQNMIVTPFGSVRRRGGTKFINEVKDSTKKVRLIPFIYETSQNYVLEVGDLYIRIYKDQELLLDEGSPIEIVTTYLEAEVNDLRVVQDASNMYIAHKDHPPAVLTRGLETEWTLEDITFISEPSEWDDNNYPTLCWFYQQRLFWAATPEQPQTIWASKIDAYFTHTPGQQLDDDPIEITIVSDTVSIIRWVSVGDVVILGTSAREFKMSSSALNEALTPTNIQINFQTNYGSAFITPVRVDSNVLFVQRGARKIRRFRFKFETDNYVAEDITIMAGHITESGIKELAHMTNPDSIVWGVLNNGVLIGLSYEPENKVIAWHHHELKGAVEAITAIPGIEFEKEDEIWVIVKREIDGEEKRYLEVLMPGLLSGTEQIDAWFIDSGISYSDPVKFDVVSGLDHLEGQEIQVFADAAIQPNRVVTGGEITLEYEANQVQVGLGYSSIIETLPIEGGNPIGVSQGLTKRVSKIFLRLFRSLGGSIGLVDQELEELYYGLDTLGVPKDFVSTNLRVDFPGDFDNDLQIKLIQDKPLPFSILALFINMRTE